MRKMSKSAVLNRSGLSVVAFMAGLAATSPHAETRNCALVEGVLPADCAHSNAGIVVSRPSPTSAGHSSAGDLGDIGFSISIDAGLTQDRQHVAGARAGTDQLARMDRMLSDLGLRVTVDGLGAQPILNVTTVDLRRSYRAGETVSFRASSNYPAWISRAEIVVIDRTGSDRAVAVLPVQPNGTVNWVMPTDGPAQMDYILRVYDGQGRRDETVPLPLIRSDSSLEQSPLTGPIIAAGEGEDRTARRRIPVRGGAITVSGTNMPAHGTLSLMGEPIVPGVGRNFVIQRILPPGTHDVMIAAGQQSQSQSVTIPRRDFFVTGIADITLGRDRTAGNTWRYGRLAGFVDGTYANGVRLRASVDTREREFRDMFSNFARRHPDQVLRQIEDRDVWITTGDDSRTENLAPTSGRFFLRMERDNNHIMWGDFRPESDLRRVIRTDRTLYGLSGRYETSETMPDGSARATVTGYAAQMDRLTQRDVFRGTGGSAYFLSRRDIEAGTETLIVETRDPVSGRVVSAQQLVEGRDYRIDYVQGLVILNAPLSPTAVGSGLATERPLGDFDVNLVAQYDYVPATGASLTNTFGGRVEGWITPNARLGFSGARETTGAADNTLIGMDFLLRRHEGTYLGIDVARSEGPGLNSRPSLTGGLDLDAEVGAAGTRGQGALGVRVDGRLDLADLGGEGHLAGWYEYRQAGFWSPDHNAIETQRSVGIDGAVGMAGAMLTFGAEEARNSAEQRMRKARIGAVMRLRDDLSLGVELAHRDRRNLSAAPPSGENGTRTDLAARLTWDMAADTQLWVFGQATLRQTGDMARDNRIGAGAKVALSDALTVSGEASTGNLGFAGRADLTYRPNATSSYRLGLREDRTLTNDLSSASRRGLTFGADRKVNDAWAVSTETVMGGVPAQRSLVSTYGVSYTPTEQHRYDMGILTGSTREADGTLVNRDGVSFGLQRSAGEALHYRLRAEYRLDRSDNPARFTRRESWLLSGNLTYKTSDDWRLIGALDVVVSDGDGAGLRDGRFVEGRIGFAYRPVANDRLNALFSYTFLDDQPGPDQVNFDGSLSGPRQRSHILNAAMSYDLDERWTLGLKYGFRYREQTDRNTGITTRSTGHLGIARLDYRIVHQWDIMGEVRAFHAPRAKTTEYGALLGVYRELNPNVRLGIGYSLSGVSDDMRRIERAKEGVFLNVIGKF
ncbi:MAG: hypothetical protein EA417_14665 [Gammaproteobacteria bacterium]|nr:MAG: hypothetical protein EA417_14665 [Gammaproteobacteria bacterium]